MASPEQQLQTMLKNLPEKTGKTLAQWLTLLADSGLDKHGKVVSLLKQQHQVSHGFANLIAHQFLNREETDKPDLVSAQYANGKEALKPIYTALTKLLTTLGDDVEFAPKKAYVSVRRKKQFAIIQASTKTRVDLGLNLKDLTTVTQTDRLELSGSFNTMVSHRVRLSSPEQVDDEVVGWLKHAYQQAG
ncbi:DUF4287 domain-containing protein [Alteromonas sp. ASW11-36]|uniref:DUF4287 domain-containing protein n=1 Tax=Alteromonas arenosi TaxID=3055817 RepID=A0ABT7STR2_9ALTE|nr:DUF4287 domain-containing protein [Alteromonas sp. ASW11-36]MDM7859584.1 DUF4287 domain-containing protein [Alteromonas sp. ASW11-36]